MDILGFGCQIFEKVQCVREREKVFNKTSVVNIYVYSCLGSALQKLF